jgi:hypothetical protein
MTDEVELKRGDEVSLAKIDRKLDIILDALNPKRKDSKLSRQTQLEPELKHKTSPVCPKYKVLFKGHGIAPTTLLSFMKQTCSSYDAEWYGSFITRALYSRERVDFDRSTGPDNPNWDIELYCLQVWFKKMEEAQNFLSQYDSERHEVYKPITIDRFVPGDLNETNHCAIGFHSSHVKDGKRTYIAYSLYLAIGAQFPEHNYLHHTFSYNFKTVQEHSLMSSGRLTYFMASGSGMVKIDHLPKTIYEKDIWKGIHLDNTFTFTTEGLVITPRRKEIPMIGEIPVKIPPAKDINITTL